MNYILLYPNCYLLFTKCAFYQGFVVRLFLQPLSANNIHPKNDSFFSKLHVTSISFLRS